MESINLPAFVSRDGQDLAVLRSATRAAATHVSMMDSAVTSSLISCAFVPLDIPALSVKLVSIFFVSPELSSVRDYVITHSVRSMCMYVCVCMWYFAKLITVSTYIDVLSWDLDTMILGWSHTCDSTDMGSKVI